MKVSKEEIAKVRKYDKLKSELSSLEEDYRHIWSICSVSNYTTYYFNKDNIYIKVLRIFIRNRIRKIKKQIKEMEN